MKRASIRNILVPIDFSGLSIQGIEIAKRLGRRFGAAVHVAHVYEPPYAAGFMGPAMAWREWPMPLAEEAGQQFAQQLESLASKYDLPGQQTHFREGTPVFDVICRLAAEIPADLLVIPTRASRGIRRFFLGSTAERLIQHSPCPILVDRKSAAQLPSHPLPAGPALEIEKILVPVDFSICSLEGLRYAIQFAQKFAAKIIVLHVLDLGYSQPLGIHATRDLPRFARAARKDAQEQMRKFLRLARFGGVRFDPAFAIGTPVEQISNLALAQDVDLVITSTHGLTGFKHVLIGSMAEQLVRHSRVPILIVPSHPEIRAANLAGLRVWRPRLRQEKESDGKGKRGAVRAKVLTKHSSKLPGPRSSSRRKTARVRKSPSR